MTEINYPPSGKDGGSAAEIAALRTTDPGFGWQDGKAFSTQPSGSPQLRLFLDCVSRICQNSFSHKWQVAPTPRSSSQSEPPRGPSGTHTAGYGGGRIGKYMCSNLGALWALRAQFPSTADSGGSKGGRKAGLVLQRNCIPVCPSKLVM